MKIWVLLPLMLLAACSNKNTGPSPVAQGESIINGKTADKDSDIVKATVALVMVDADRTRSFCTGTLVSKDIIITAAHCVEPIMSGYQMQVSFGGETFTSKNEGELREIDRFYTYEMVYPSAGHPEAVRTINDLKDIAVIKLLTTAPKWAIPATILGSEASLAVGQEVTVAGFGRMKEDQAAMATELQQTQLKIQNIESKRIELDQTQGTGACWGDSGGPALIRTEQELIVIGVLSGATYGNQNCHSGTVYTSLAGYKDFIQKVVSVMGGEAPSFTE
ncbi:trypsin-like serine protease [Bdellovibrio sp. SKB1291214]|uniref:S1 family peptidase n=1 Tax=Bdellovibrio sp. SKB1291214 TaxID=1732569 RepID=UPI000B51527B|nr:trypsin-like serine protease [Bdellovibrio sp. SKB1291214]UYL09591.1 trypsin-like serine protease [Bdellovibrio sp. SKB1291214]